jgi:hypothetical protein
MTTMKHTARAAGLAYAGLAVAGMLGFLLIRSQLYVPGDAAGTAARLVSHAGLARLGIAADLTGALAQALTALWLFKLFQRAEPFAAIAIAAFGLVNSVIILVGAVFSATALGMTLDGAPTPAGNRADTVLLLYNLNDATWKIGALFFGLWLIPMGWSALRSTFMPRRLGQLLLIGGGGYIASAFAGFLAGTAPATAYALTAPASAGEFWMVGYLLVMGLRRTSAVADDAELPGMATP